MSERGAFISHYIYGDEDREAIVAGISKAAEENKAWVFLSPPTENGKAKPIVCGTLRGGWSEHEELVTAITGIKTKLAVEFIAITERGLVYRIIKEPDGTVLAKLMIDGE